MGALQRKIYGVQPKKEFHEKGYCPIEGRDFWDGFVVVAKRLPEAMKLVDQKIAGNAPLQILDHFDFEVIGIANEKVKSGIILESFVAG